MKRPSKSTRRDKSSYANSSSSYDPRFQDRNSKGTTKGYPEQKAQKEHWNQTNGIHRFHLTESQQELSDKIDSNDLVFAIGPAGVGKSSAVLYNFVKEYLKDSTKQIIVVRTPIQSGLDDVGHLPDTLEAKMEPHFASAKMILEGLLSKGKVETDMGHRIHFKIPNFMLGSTFDNSLVLADECQAIPPLILKLIMERTGVNSKIVLSGDNSQMYFDAKGRNGLRDAIPRFFEKEGGEYVPKYPYVAYHEFDVEDVQRSDLVKTVIRAYGSDV